MFKVDEFHNSKSLGVLVCSVRSFFFFDSFLDMKIAAKPPELI